MAQTKAGQKFNRVPEHKRKLESGKTITVREHVRSNPKTSRGKRK